MACAARKEHRGSRSGNAYLIMYKAGRLQKLPEENNLVRACTEIFLC